MIKIEKITNLVINKDRHVKKTTNEFNVLPYEVIVTEFQSVGFQVIEYTEQSYYDRSIVKDRHGKGLFRMDLVSPFNPLIGVTLSSANDNQMSLYIHATVRGIPVKELARIKHLNSATLDLDLKKIVSDLEALRDQFATLADTEIKQSEVFEAFQVLNTYRAEIITNSNFFATVQSVNKWELFQNLADSMIEGKGVSLDNKARGRKTRAIIQIRKRFLLGQKIFETVTK